MSAASVGDGPVRGRLVAITQQGKAEVEITDNTTVRDVKEAYNRHVIDKRDLSNCRIAFNASVIKRDSNLKVSGDGKLAAADDDNIKIVDVIQNEVLAKSLKDSDTFTGYFLEKGKPKT